MRTVAALLSFIVIVPLVQALDYEDTAKGPAARCVQCTPVATPAVPVATQAQPASLYAGPPGAPASIGNVQTRIVSTQVATPTYQLVPYFKRTLKEEKYTEMSPVEFTYDKAFIYHETVPVQKTGVSTQTNYKSYPTTQTLNYTVYDQCGNVCGTKAQDVTTWHTKAYNTDTVYNYTVNESRERVGHRQEIGIKLEPVQRTRILDTFEVAQRGLKTQTILIIQESTQTATGPVPLEEAEAALKGSK